MKPRNVLVNICREGEDETRAYRARLIDQNDKSEGLLEERAGSNIPRGWYHLSTIFDAKTREALG